MHLHLVSFDVPYPPDYCGIIDVYNRVCTLSAAGVKVHLHCYAYGRAEAPELANICEEVHYYPRETGWRHQFDRRPYIVASRCSQALLQRLRCDNYPIVLEGLHNAFVLEQLAPEGRKIAVRAHNVEHDYYLGLAQAEPVAWKRWFYRIEARKLRRYEPVLRQATLVMAVTDEDARHFKELGCNEVVQVTSFHGHTTVESRSGRGEYVLYHGNLSVIENRQAAIYLLDNVFPNTEIPLVIAGRNPDNVLQERVAQCPNVQLVSNPDDDTMRRLIREAHVNLLVTAQPTGLKLKLLNALYEGRHCLVNSAMLSGTPFAEVCHVADTPEAMRETMQRLMQQDFSEEELAHRTCLLQHTAAASLQWLQYLA